MLSDWYLAAQELREARNSGCALVVDLTVQGLGPSPSLSVRAANEAGLPVVTAVGRYVVAALAPEQRELSADALADEWIATVENGMDGCAVGIIGEIGVSRSMHDAEHRSLHAAALTHKNTGLGVNVHIEPGYGLGTAHEALDVLESGGADPAKTAISHVDYETDLDALIRLARRGCYLEFDLFARSFPPVSEQERLRTILSLVEAGYGERILLSQDICMRHSLLRWGGPGYAHLAREIHPELRHRVGSATTDLLISENPLRFLSVDS
jgi:phosphotriesterase-related protein